jgi:hypothetical protein
MSAPCYAIRMNVRAFRPYGALVFLIGLLASAACTGLGSATPGSGALQLSPSSAKAPAMPKSTEPCDKADQDCEMCEKLDKGEPSIKVDMTCSFVAEKHILNGIVCYKPDNPQNCTSPREAAVAVWETNYKGIFTFSDKTKSLPKAIVSSSWFISGLCGDVGKDASFDSADVIKVTPPAREYHGQKAGVYFTIIDEGPRFKYYSGTSSCYVVFYDDKNKFVEFDVFME